MCTYKDDLNGVCGIRLTPCNNCKTRLNVDVTRGVKWRSPNVWNKFDNAYDNLMYAILIRAVADARGYNDFETHKANNGKDAVAWLDTTGRIYYEYLTKYGK